MVGESEFWASEFDLLAVPGMICLTFQDRFDILLEKRPSGVAGLKYIIVYGKSRMMGKMRTSKLWSGVITFLTVFVLVGSGAEGKTIHVKLGATGDGSSWASAYGSFQSGLDDAEPNDSIWVAEGTYVPTQLYDPCDVRSATFQMKNGVGVYGGFPAVGEPNWGDRDWEEYEAVLSGDLAGNDVEVDDPCDLWDEPSRFENSYHVVMAIEIDASAVMDGITVTGGCADGESEGDRRGGGIYSDMASPTLIRCMLTGNCSYAIVDTRGAGMYNAGGSPEIRDCIFTKNVAAGAASVLGAGLCNDEGGDAIVEGCTFSRNLTQTGAGICNIDSNSTVLDCLFEDNLAWDGGGIYNWTSDSLISGCTFVSNRACSGAGMFNRGGRPVVMDCDFTGNAASVEGCGPDSGGGGMSNVSSSPSVIRCRFMSNTGGLGAGMYTSFGSPQVDGCTFSGNAAAYAAGGMDNYYADAVVSDCLFTNNSASYGGAIRSLYSQPILRNCVITDNHVPLGASYSTYGGGLFSGNDSFTILEECVVAGNAAQYGGGLYHHGSRSRLVNCRVVGNVAEHVGGAVYNKSSSGVDMIHCTLAGNTSPLGSGLGCDLVGQSLPGVSELSNCILWNEGTEVWNNDDSAITMFFTDIRGGWPGAGNIDADPCFADSGYWDPNGTAADVGDDFFVSGDYHLKSQGGRYDPTTQSWIYDDVTGPCLDAADPMSPIGAEPFPSGGVVNMGAYGGTAEASKSYFGKPPCEIIVAGDVNGDCAVDFLDFRLIGLHWCEDTNP